MQKRRTWPRPISCECSGPRRPIYRSLNSFPPPTLWQSIPRLKYRCRATPTVRGVGRTARVSWSFSRRPFYFGSIRARYQPLGRAGRRLRCSCSIRPHCRLCRYLRPTGRTTPRWRGHSPSVMSPIWRLSGNLCPAAWCVTASRAATSPTELKKRGTKGPLNAISGRFRSVRFHSQNRGSGQQGST